MFDKKLFRKVIDYQGLKKHDADSTRQQEMDADFLAFAQGYVDAANDTDVIWSVGRIEDDFGLEPGSVKALIDHVGQGTFGSKPQPNAQNALVLMLLYGLWSGDTRYTHIESRELTV